MRRWLLGGGVVLLTLCGASLAAQVLPNWTQKIPANAPPARFVHAMAYDAARAQVVLFGGAVGGLGNDTWVWDGTNWTQKSPATSPPPRWFHAMAYDAARGQVVLFGGSDSNNVIYNDTWVWDGTNWIQKNPVNSPPSHYDHAMAYDAARGQVVLFGGTVGPFTNDTWVWDGTNWTQKGPLNSPQPRGEHAMAYDAARGQVILFGGLGRAMLNDTWAWDGTNWTQKSPLNSPTPRGEHAMAYDAARGQVVLFGGTDINNVRYNDTWVWDGTNWTQMIPLNSPAPRVLHAMAYDAARGQVALFGGLDGGSSIRNDTWVWPGLAVCKVSDLAPVDATVSQFELPAPVAPTFSLVGPYVDRLLDFGVTSLQTRMSMLGIPFGERLSGYRPPAYQAHFWDIREADRKLQTAHAATPQLGAVPPILQAVDQACSAIIQHVNLEISKHQLTRNSTSGLLAVSNPAHPWTATHSVNPAQAMDIHVADKDRTAVDGIAASNGLYRPYPKSDPSYHLERSTGIPMLISSITVTAHSPIAILVRDPLGRRIGFNPATSSVINEIGTGTATYSGPTTDPQVVDIAAALDGIYTVSATGTGSGTYSLTIEKTDEHGNTTDSQSQTGNVVPGQSVTLTLGTPVLLGDVNKDGSVNCADLAIVRAAFGMRAAQAGFDSRADLNIDGVIDIRDLALVSQRLPAGTRCQ